MQVDACEAQSSTIRGMSSPPHSRRPLLVAGVALICIAIALYTVGQGAIGQWLALTGAISCLLYFVIRRAAKPPPAGPHPESMLFSQTTTLESLEAGHDDNKH